MGYSPILGRFLRRDPIGYVPGLNVYLYVFDAPINFVDPFGLAPTAAVAGCNPCNSSGGSASQPSPPASFAIQCYGEIAGLKHCWINISDSGGTTIGTISGSPSKHVGAAALILDPGNVIYKPDNDLNPPPLAYNSPITLPANTSACDFAKCLDSAASAFQGLNLPYSAVNGPNSNTLANYALSKCGGTGNFPIGAAGSTGKSLWYYIWYEWSFDDDDD